MKHYVLYYLLLGIFFGGSIFLLDYWSDETKSIPHYIFTAMAYAALLTLFRYIDHKGWNSWKRLSNLLGKKQ